jgi:hypothetical protein
MSGWVDGVIERMKAPIAVNVKHLNLKDGAGALIESLEVLPLSANEFQVLKSHPDMRDVSGYEERAERLGLLVTFEMIRKCDKTVTLAKFKQLPLTLLNDLSTAIMGATKEGDGDADPLSE